MPAPASARPPGSQPGPAPRPAPPPAPGRQRLSFDSSDNSGVGVVTSLVVHAGIITASLAAWQAAPIAPPPEVVPVLIVSEVPGGIGDQAQTSAAEATDGMGESAPPQAAAAEPPPAAEPVPETAPEPAPPVPPPPPVPQAKARPAPPPPTPQRQAAPPPPPARNATRPAAPPPPSPQQAQRRAPPPPPASQAATRPPPTPAQPRPQQSTQQRAPAQASATPGRAREEARVDDFDLPAARTSATGADSGGRNVPSMKGQQGAEANASAAGRGQVLGGDLGASLLAQVRDCWRVPENPEAARRVVTVRFRLTPEGRLRGSVTLVDPSRRPTGNSPETVAVDRALTAVQQCATANGRTGYELPADRYEEWNEVIIRIGLGTMRP